MKNDIFSKIVVSKCKKCGVAPKIEQTPDKIKLTVDCNCPGKDSGHTFKFQ